MSPFYSCFFNNAINFEEMLLIHISENRWQKTVISAAICQARVPSPSKKILHNVIDEVQVTDYLRIQAY